MRKPAVQLPSRSAGWLSVVLVGVGLVPAGAHADLAERDGALASVALGSPFVASVEAQSSARRKSRAPRCFGRRATIVVRGRSAKGTAKADVIVVVNRKGARVDGGGGDDRICGGPGRDVLVGGRGNDKLAGAGRDRLIGGKGVDEFRTKGRRVRTDIALGELLNGRRKTVEHRVRARASTVVLPVGAVRSVSGDPTGRQTVVLEGAKAPRVGRVLVLVASSRRDGLLGRVVARKRLSGGRVAVTTVPVTLDQAYARFQAKFRGTLDQLGARAVGAAGVNASAKPQFRCKGSTSKPVDVDFDLSSVVFEGTIDPNPANPTVSLMVTGRPRVLVKVQAAGDITCGLHNAPSVFVPVVGPVGISIKPAFRVSTSGAVSVDYNASARLVYHFQRAKRGANSDTRSFKPMAGHPTVNGSGSLSAALAMNTSLSIGGRVSIGGEIGPNFSAKIRSSATSSGVTACATVNVGMHVALTVNANVFVRDWPFTIWKGTFGNAELLNRCTPAGGGGPGDRPPMGVEVTTPISGPMGYEPGIRGPACVDSAGEPALLFVSADGDRRYSVWSQKFIQDRWNIAGIMLNYNWPGDHHLAAGTYRMSFECVSDYPGLEPIWSDPGFDVTWTGTWSPVQLHSGTVAPGDAVEFVSGVSNGPAPCPTLSGGAPIGAHYVLYGPGGTVVAQKFVPPSGGTSETLAVPADLADGIDLRASVRCSYDYGNGAGAGYAFQEVFVAVVDD